MGTAIIAVNLLVRSGASTLQNKLPTNIMELKLYGNNKGTLYMWGEFLTYHHTFGSRHKVVDIRANSEATTKYELLIDGCTDASIEWMLANFQPTKEPPSTSITKFKRIFTAPKLPPIWTVNRNNEIKNFFSGSEEGAKAAFLRLQSNKLTWLIKLECPELKVREIWEKTQQTVR